MNVLKIGGLTLLCVLMISFVVGCIEDLPPELTGEQPVEVVNNTSVPVQAPPAPPQYDSYNINYWKQRLANP